MQTVRYDHIVEKKALAGELHSFFIVAGLSSLQLSNGQPSRGVLVEWSVERVERVERVSDGLGRARSPHRPDRGLPGAGVGNIL
eukprot:1391852-Amorphochlora_amoeboformis.AAC.2